MGHWSLVDWKSNLSKVNAFKNLIEGYWFKVLVIALLWTMAKAFLINFYGLSLGHAVLESGIQTCTVILGFWLLGNIFQFFTPQRQQLWLVVTLPLIVASGLTLMLFYLPYFIVPEKVDYVEFLAKTSLIKGFYFFLLFQVWTIFLVFAGKLEDQRILREKEEKTIKLAKEAEMYFLRQQIQPHFLFNSLNSINSLILKSPEQASEMVIQLADFLRASIKKDGQKWIKVGEELEVVQQFLGIEKVRFKDRLHLDIQVDENSLEEEIPQLMIQPLLENAIKHGLYGVTEKVEIVILIKKVGNYVEIRISNPIGSQTGDPRGSGFGLDAVKRRLFLLFGRHDLLQIEKGNNKYHVKLMIPIIK
jgi:two-component system LytT family sensor kinase